MAVARHASEARPAVRAAGARRPAARLLPVSVVVAACLLQLLSLAQAFVVQVLAPARLPGCIGTPRPRLPQPAARAAPVQMIGDLFNLFGGSSEPQGIPRSIKDGVNALRFATQRALRDRQSRIEVNLPRGVPLGVEAPNLDKDGDKYEKSDRELARLVVELFKPIIDSTVVVFQQQRQARKAADIWGTALVKTTSFEQMGAAPTVGSAGKRGGKKKKGGFGGADGGGGGVGASAIPPGTEVLIVVAPSPKELKVVRRISDELGVDTLIIVLNTPINLAAAYMDKDDAAALLKAFEPVLYLNPINDPSVKTLDNMLLFRSYPGQWQIAQKGALGPPAVLASKDGRFEKEEALAALRKGADNNAKPLAEKLMGGLFGGN